MSHSPPLGLEPVALQSQLGPLCENRDLRFRGGGHGPLLSATGGARAPGAPPPPLFTGLPETKQKYTVVRVTDHVSEGASELAADLIGESGLDLLRHRILQRVQHSACQSGKNSVC